ncbi:uncharacterized protein LOC111825456 isoform X1 [Myotis lucifugus]|uniref:uncharacterized protein LOC111825456 isoform X1 n=1 Tax=Myotis lucifugus TaxID=59463 RepID=UPI000CCC5DBC|nr:uncharacterized protein LOC111825456 isoform X1 [Myotis lucifugus]
MQRARRPLPDHHQRHEGELPSLGRFHKQSGETAVPASDNSSSGSCLLGRLSESGRHGYQHTCRAIPSPKGGQRYQKLRGGDSGNGAVRLACRLCGQNTGAGLTSFIPLAPGESIWCVRRA